MNQKSQAENRTNVTGKKRAEGTIRARLHLHHSVTDFVSTHVDYAFSEDAVVINAVRRQEGRDVVTVRFEVEPVAEATDVKIDGERNKAFAQITGDSHGGYATYGTIHNLQTTATGATADSFTFGGDNGPDRPFTVDGESFTISVSGK